MTETRTNKDFTEMMSDPELDPKVKEFLAMLQNDDDVPPDLLEKLCSDSLPELIDKLLEENEVDEDKIKQADSFFESIKSFIDENEWLASIVDRENRVLIIGFPMRNTSLQVMVCVDAEVESVTINTTLPILCLKEYRMLMGWKLSQLNENLRYGGFRLDEDDGEITYRFTYSISGLEFSSKMFCSYLFCCLITPDRNYKKIVKVATGALSKEEKVEALGNLKALAVAISD